MNFEKTQVGLLLFIYNDDIEQQARLTLFSTSQCECAAIMQLEEVQ